MLLLLLSQQSSLRASSLPFGSHTGISKAQHNTPLAVVSGLQGQLLLEQIHDRPRITSVVTLGIRNNCLVMLLD